MACGVISVSISVVVNVVVKVVVSVEEPTSIHCQPQALEQCCCMYELTSPFEMQYPKAAQAGHSSRTSSQSDAGRLIGAGLGTWESIVRAAVPIGIAVGDVVNITGDGGVVDDST
jgi:hypothetical protein